MLKDLSNKDEGVVFVTVLIVIIVMMVLTITIIGLNMNQIVSSEKEVKRIQSELLAQGALSLMLVNQMESNGSVDNITYTETLDDVDFAVTIDLDNTFSGTFGTNDLLISVDH